MKDVLYMIAFAVILSPCLLILNESDTFVPNFIGLAYLILLVLVSKTRLGIRFLDRIGNASDNTCDKLFNNK